MITYRLAEFGVERLEPGQSTFIPPDLAHPAWREFQAWCAQGNQPLAASVRPVFGQPRPTKNLWIIGTGGYGREVCGAVSSAREAHDWAVAGFLNDQPEVLDRFPALPRIRGGTDYQPQENDVFICAIGDIAGRKKVCAQFQERGARFINLVQQAANLSPSAELGCGVIVEALVGIGANCRIGDFTMIMTQACLGHDVVVGPGSHIAPFACILGRAQIGAETLIGSHAVVLADVKIGARATVGAGSVVIKDVPDDATVFGVPARQLQ